MLLIFNKQSYHESYIVPGWGRVLDPMEDKLENSAHPDVRVSEKCYFHKPLPRRDRLHAFYIACSNLKILPSSHSTATWCIMVNVSMWCLNTTAHKEWCARYYYRNDKESYTFQRQNLFILQHDVHTNIP